jgi:hypothetical protein
MITVKLDGGQSAFSSAEMAEALWNKLERQAA